MWTMPRSGLLAESRFSRTSDSAYNESPGNTRPFKSYRFIPKVGDRFASGIRHAIRQSAEDESFNHRPGRGLRPGIFVIDKEWILIHRYEGKQRAVVTADRAARPMLVNAPAPTLE